MINYNKLFSIIFNKFHTFFLMCQIAFSSHFVSIFFTGSHPEFACLTSPHGRELLEYFVKEVGVDVIAPYATVDHLRYIEKNQTIVDECISYGYCDALQYCLQECNVPVTMHLVQVRN